MKKVSVLLAFVCDPYLAILQKRLYKKYWEKEIDELLINVNGRNDRIRKYIVDLWKDELKVKRIDEINREIRQGLAFNRIYPFVEGDILMTLDSDNFIYAPGIVNSVKEVLTEYDSCGSTGYNIQPSKLSMWVRKKYGTVRLNPFMSFWKKEILDSIGRIEFGTYNFKKGDIFEPLGTMPCDGWIDIMGKMSLEYFYRVGSYHKIQRIEEGKYMHVGGLSSIFRSIFKSLEDENTQKFVRQSNRPIQMRYFAARHFLYELTKNECPFKDFNKQYEEGFAELLYQGGESTTKAMQQGREMLHQYRSRFL